MHCFIKYFGLTGAIPFNDDDRDVHGGDHGGDPRDGHGDDGDHDVRGGHDDGDGHDAHGGRDDDRGGHDGDAFLQLMVLRRRTGEKSPEIRRIRQQ
ncbi:hypothetical protein NPIL_28101 [Nephila pilipes]|uniref:Uncharacterized protein n=1 Tax=Nephila pilipes TaxID=299642 RepID=A0A8X6PNC1_NEPPI|nr:hypothetical protein NPIL_28101 [Nephila pilipes]